MPFSSGELLVIMIVLIVIIGPSRLPEVTATITRWVKNARVQLTALRASLDAEAGDDLRNLDLSALDVRQYDPRRIIRQAVQEEMQEWKDLVNPLVPLNSKDHSRPGPARPTTPSSSITPSAAAATTAHEVGTPAFNSAVGSPGLPPGTVSPRGDYGAGERRVSRSRYTPSARESAIAD